MATDYQLADIILLSSFYMKSIQRNWKLNILNALLNYTELTSYKKLVSEEWLEFQ